MKQLKLILQVFIILCLFYKETCAQTLPYTFQNSSRYADNEIYIGLVGQFPGMGNVWMDMTQSQLQVMSYSNNTVPGPAWGNTPDGKNKYAAMFFKLSDIPNKTIQIPQGLFGCRILISFKSPMYIYFHQTGGYAGADLQNPTDPNDGIRWELVELTWGNAGLWTNTSRVDSYQYPMGLEVTGYTGGISGSYASSYNTRIHDGSAPNVNKKIGEVISHQNILNSWTTKVETPFYGCKVVKTHSMDGEAIIEQASKIPDFKSNGAYKDYFAAYINDIWNTYSSKDLLLNIGDRGTWRGRVTGNRFDFYDPADNSQATIYWKPSTQDAIEGAGALATTYATAPSAKYDEDLMIQAQVCAAINRHAIYTNAAVGEVQYNADATRFFKVAPFNQYVNFFHSTDISYQSQTYAFAYDDVGDQSSTIQCTFPTNVKVIIGGYGEQVAAPIPVPGIIEAEAFSNMFGIQTETTSDIGLGSNVGYIDTNDWLEFDINATKTASYDFSFRSASLANGGVLSLLIDGVPVSQSLSLPVTSGWQQWMSTTLQSVPLTQGVHKLKVLFVDGGFNLNYINVTEHVDVCTATITSTSTSFCQGGNVILTASAGASYKWLNGTTQVGTAQTYTTTAVGSYTVEVTNTAGCKATSAAKAITVDALPTATITSTSTSFCQGGNVILTASAGASYKWMNGTTQVGTAGTYTATAAGLYTVEVTNAAGCKATSSAKVITVTPSVVWYADTDGDGKGDPNSTLNACTQPSGYASIAGDACPADANKIAAGNCGCGNTEQSCLDCAGVANGTAALDVCNICSGGTTGITPKLHLNECTSTAISNPSGIEYISIYPNPFENKVTIDTKGTLVSFYIYDAAGSLVETVELDSETQIGEQLNSGIYLVRYKMNANWYQFKIIKM